MATRIPINKDNGYGFEDRQKKIWEEMETDMERRRREWEEEIEKMRREFFMLRPEGEERAGLGGGGPSAMPLGMAGERLGPRSRLLEPAAPEDSRGMIVKDDKGNPVFKVLFDVHDYRPEEVAVKMDANKIMVSARHEAMQGGSSVSREYSREVKIPNELDPMTLQCTMGPDGILTVEAPLPVPKYSAIKDSTVLPIKTGSPGGSGSSTPLSSTTSSSYQTTSSYQTGPRDYKATDTGMNPSGPPGFKPVSAPYQNSVPTSSTMPSTSYTPNTQPTLQQQAASTVSSSQSAYRDTAGQAPAAGYSKVSPPFQSFTSQQTSAASSYSPPIKSGAVGRIGSPVVSQDRDGKFKLEIDIEDFKPEELTVKTQDRKVVVCARREEKSGNRTSTRELSREHTLPDTVDPLTIKAFFTDGGKLIVEAPYRDATPAQITGR